MAAECKISPQHVSGITAVWRMFLPVATLCYSLALRLDTPYDDGVPAATRHERVPPMSRLVSCLSVSLVLLIGNLCPAFAEPEKNQSAEKPESKKTAEKEKEPKTDKPASVASVSIEDLVKSVRNSVVVITVTGRNGDREGIGSGFVISPDGLIATNMHVIGEARPISVQTADGKRLEVTDIHASDRHLDLAILKVAEKNLPVLQLGDSAKLAQGQSVAALGNPLGLKHSVTTGVVSAVRDLDGREMIQLAIPAEPGNSGGPVVDLQGRVQGIVTLKSSLTANLAFAVPVNVLKPLLEKPNPIPMQRWLTIGTLDPKEWTPKFGARWRQRSGRIMVDGMGSGFGGRSICLAEIEAPDLPYELAVTVKLDDEAGAAGLVFHGDGHDKHYGFYPSAGQLRLSRFEGPDVNSWAVLRQEPSEHYQPGDWNTLKVRLEKEKILCFVNDHLVIEAASADVAGKRLGLAKFRTTHAEFKNFRAAEKVASSQLPAEKSAHVAKLVGDIPATGPLPEKLIGELLPEADHNLAALAQRAKLLEQQSKQLKQLSRVVHQRRAINELAKALEGKEEEIDLFRAALLIAWLDNEEVDVAAYCRELDRMSRELVAKLPADADESAKLSALNEYLFQSNGFHGSRGDYYNRSNSYVNEVLDDREGLPITLSLIYIELGQRLGLKIEGVGLPGHFVVRHIPAKGEKQLIDAYEGGKPLTRAEAEQQVRENTGLKLTDEQTVAVNKRAIIVRMLHNLLGVSRRNEDLTGALRYLEAIVTLMPEAAEDRFMRAVLRAQTGQKDAALSDIDWLIEHEPAGIDLTRVEELRALVLRSVR